MYRNGRSAPVLFLEMAMRFIALAVSLPVASAAWGQLWSELFLKGQAIKKEGCRLTEDPA